MSLDEDLDFKDHLLQILEESGSLAALKAQLRAIVFLALDDGQCIKNSNPLKNSVSIDFVQTEEGRLCAAVVYDFLQKLRLTATISVFSREIGTDVTPLTSNPGLEKFSGESAEDPFLLSIIRKSVTGSNSPGPAGCVQDEKVEEKQTASTGVLTVSSESNENDSIAPAAPLNNWLSKTDEGKIESKSKSGTSSELETEVVGKSPGGNVKKGGSSSLLGDLPQLAPRTLPPLTGSRGSDKDFTKLLNDSLENIDSASADDDDDDSSTPPGLSPKAPTKLPVTGIGGISSAKLEKQTPVDFPYPQLQREKSIENKPSTTPFFNRNENESSSISEEIVEELEVDDLLNSGRSEKQISF